MLSDHTLQAHRPALSVGQVVRGQDLRPGVAAHGVGPQSQGRQEVVVAGPERGGEDQEVDQAGGWRSGVELALVLALVTPRHPGDLEVVVRRAGTVEQGDPGGGGEHGASRGEDRQLGQPQPGDGGRAQVGDPAGQHRRAAHHRRQVGLPRALEGRGRAGQGRQSVVEGENSHLRPSLASDQTVLVLISLLVIVEQGGCLTQTVKCEAQSEQHH